MDAGFTVYALIVSFIGQVGAASIGKESSLEASAPAVILVSLTALVTMVVVVTMCACCEIEPARTEPDIIVAQTTPSINVTNISSVNGQPAQVSHYESGGEVQVTGYKMM